MISSLRAKRGNPPKQPVVYIMCNKRNGTLYIGVTSNLIQRAYQHKEKVLKGFSAKHGCDKLVYYEIYEDMSAAITREKQIKAGSRVKKLMMIDEENPDWVDLYDSIT